MSSTSLSTGLAPLWLTFFLGMFYGIVNGAVFLTPLADNSLLVYRNATDFWILSLYPATWLNSFMRYSSFLVNTLRLSLYIGSFHLQVMTELFLPSQFGCLVSFFIQLLWLGIPIPCWIEVGRVDILVSFLIWRRMLLASSHWVWR